MSFAQKSERVFRTTVKNKKILFVLIAALIVAILATAALLGWGTKKTHFDIIFFGDSRVGNDRTDTALPVLLENAVNMSVYNAGIGGSTLSYTGEYPTWDIYSMVSLSKAVAANDFSIQLANSESAYFDYAEIVDYVPDTVKDISKIDFKKAKYVIIEQGTNDYLSGMKLEGEDKYDESSVGGALRTSIKNIKKASPDAKIILISTCFTSTPAGYGDELDMGYGTEEDFAEFEKKIAEETGVLFVDLYHESGINRDNFKDYLFDGLHPNDAGNKVVIDLLTKKFNLD